LSNEVTTSTSFCASRSEKYRFNRGVEIVGDDAAWLGN